MLRELRLDIQQVYLYILENILALRQTERSDNLIDIVIDVTTRLVKQIFEGVETDIVKLIGGPLLPSCQLVVVFISCPTFILIESQINLLLRRQHLICMVHLLPGDIHVQL